MLELKKVALHQGEFELRADWRIDAGARVAIIGPSGAGKSTLLAAIAGFLRPQGGEILWDGRDFAQIRPGKRPLSMIFQDQNLFPHLNLAQNLVLGIAPDVRLGKAHMAQVGAALERVGLAGYERRRPSQLSGGELARAALARAALRARPLLLLDEPFAALGPAMRADMLALVAELADETGAAVLLVSHAPDDLRDFAQLTIFVTDGIAHPPVPTAQLFGDPPPALRAYLGV